MKKGEKILGYDRQVNEKANLYKCQIDPTLKGWVIEMLKESKECIAWDYHEILGLSWELV